MTNISIPDETKGCYRGAVPARRGTVAWLTGPAVAAALFLAAPMLTSVPAQADPMFPLAPACDGQYEFSGNKFEITRGEKHSIRFPVSGEKVVPGKVEESYWVPNSGGFGALDDGGLGFNTGTASGGIKGGNKIDITVNWADGETSTYTGKVEDDGYARGRYEGGIPHVDVFVSPGSVLWRSTETLTCVTPEAPKPPRPIAPPPPPDPAPESKPVQEIKVSWKEITPSIAAPFGGISAFVSISNNENKPAVGCVYKYELAERQFTVTGSEEVQIDFLGPKSYKYWPVTVTCDNGLKYEGGTTY